MLSMINALRRGLETAFLLLLVLFLFSGGNPVLPIDLFGRAHRFTAPVEFDYIRWTLDALLIKLGQNAIDTPAFFDEGARRRIVMDYLDLVGQLQQAEHRLGLVYADPSIADPGAASAALQVELERLRARQAQLAPLAEAVLEEQLGAVLEEIDLTAAGQPLPPVLFHISALPYHLVISPRDRIQQDAAIALVPGLSVERQAALEEQVDQALGVSSLTVPVGGIGSYPTMVMRSTSLLWLTDTIAHEWIHNWLGMQPLGSNYATTPELRTMNETTASIAGGEIAALLVQRYYPELLSGPSPLVGISLPAGPVLPGDLPRPSFDFRAEMHRTRLRVDELLSQGRIEEAEAYMEERRLVFWENGHAIRKLNQAYFAFYGAYADVPGGAAGEDPVGPAVRALRAQSASLTDFLQAIAAMDSFDELQAAVAR